ncbi:hypothetical protein OS121_24775 [Mycolicibacterium mucogenicum]|uniref:hypothetical protein n=1 Tax=Mycolicibacterium mucogenicum TaxID=56689 RepID=UPI00226AE3BC|nr:hypothetical protein [Mycolicibacterium mucogenicum]MCX8558267.1 hypothetical protein [Mycolicibacterium mucogenicum]
MSSVTGHSARIIGIEAGELDFLLTERFRIRRPAPHSTTQSTTPVTNCFVMETTMAMQRVAG